MSKTVEITMTQRGYEVVIAGRSTAFPSLDAAVTFAQERLAYVEYVRDLKLQID